MRRVLVIILALTAFDYVVRAAYPCSAFGFSTDCSDETQSGNAIDETGQPVSLP
jgi:hypothetical protein